MLQDVWLEVSDHTTLFSRSLRSFLYGSSLYSCYLFLISSASVRYITFLSFIVSIFAWNVPLISLIFLKKSLFFSILLFSCISLHYSLRKTFLSLLAIIWNSAFSCMYLSFSSLSFTCLPFSDIPCWSSKETENPQGIWLWRSVGFDYRISTGLGKQSLGRHKQNIVSTRIQGKRTVTPQETKPYLPVSVWDSLVGTCANNCLMCDQGHWLQQSWEAQHADISPFGGGLHYLNILQARLQQYVNCEIPNV